MIALALSVLVSCLTVIAFQPRAEVLAVAILPLHVVQTETVDQHVERAVGAGQIARQRRGVQRQRAAVAAELQAQRQRVARRFQMVADGTVERADPGVGGAVVGLVAAARQQIALVQSQRAYRRGTGGLADVAQPRIDEIRAAADQLAERQQPRERIEHGLVHAFDDIERAEKALAGQLGRAAQEVESGFHRQRQFQRSAGARHPLPQPDNRNGPLSWRPGDDRLA